MFARSVTERLKPNSVAEFKRIFEREVLPVLQRQKGFQNGISLIAFNGLQAIELSLWDQKADAEAYQRTRYSEVQHILSKVIEGYPQVLTYDVGTSTFHNTTARV